MGRKDRADRIHRLVETRGDVPVGGFEGGDPLGRSIELFGEPRSVGLRRIELQGEGIGAEIAFDPPRHRRLQRGER